MKNIKIVIAARNSNNSKTTPGNFQKRERETNDVFVNRRRPCQRKRQQFAYQQPAYPVLCVEQPYIAVVAPTFNQQPALIYQHAQVAHTYQQGSVALAYQ